MKAFAQTPPAGAAELPPQPSRATYAAGFLVALGIHAAILFLWPQAPPGIVRAEFGVEKADASVEVELVAAPLAEEAPPVVESAPATPPPPPTPEPAVEPPPPVEPVKAEMTLPEPAPPKPEPPSIRREKPKIERKEPPKPQPAPRPTRVAGAGSSAVPGNDATTARASSGANTAKPGYLRNPHPAYPEAARAARQQGTVTLLVGVDAGGNVTSVKVSRSSGSPLLDERARDTVASRWKFRPARAGGVPVPSSVSIPITFTLSQ